MLPKNRDRLKLGNWRPISILLLFYELFSRIFYNRISPRLLDFQSPDQYAFTPGVRIEDAFLYIETSVEHVIELNVPLWVFSMDLRNAFDTVNHKAFLKALGYHGVDSNYIGLIQKIYRNQMGKVGESGYFNIERGVNKVIGLAHYSSII